MGQRNYLLDFSLGGIPCQLSAVTPEYKAEKAAAYHIHRHSSFELHVVFRGSLGIRIDGRLYSICAGQGLLIAPDIYHTNQFFSDDLHKMCLTFELPRPEQLREAQHVQLSAAFYGQTCAVISTEDLLQSLRELCALVQRYPNTGWDSERLKATMVLLILSIFEKLDTPLSVHHAAPPPSGASAFIIDEFFNLHYHLNSGNELLARQLHMSTRQLDRVLQKHYNMNYREKLLDIRLTNALDFLLTTDKSIAEISELVGYSTPANFSAFIKKATGRTPSEIRKSRTQK